MITCPTCMGTDHRHNTLHERHPAGGGGTNRPCPVAAVEDRARELRDAVLRLAREVHAAPGGADPDTAAVALGCAQDAYVAYLCEHAAVLGRLDRWAGDVDDALNDPGRPAR